MATSREFVNFIMDQCAGLPVRCRAMMGEYVFYYRDKVAGGLYDNRFMVKDVPAARGKMPDAPAEPPYEGARSLLIVEREDREFLSELLEAMYPELPAPKKRNPKEKRHD